MGRRAQFHLVCQSCGETFYSYTARVYCDSCFRAGKSLKLFRKLEEYKILTSKELELMTKEHDLSISRVHQLLKETGWEYVRIWKRKGTVIKGE